MQEQANFAQAWAKGKEGKDVRFDPSLSNKPTVDEHETNLPQPQNKTLISPPFLIILQTENQR